MSWRDILKFENRLTPILNNIKHHHTTTVKMGYVPKEEMRDFIKLYGQFMRKLNDPDINLGNFEEIARPMDQYYYKLQDAPEFHHREFGILHGQVFDALRELRRLSGEGDGI